jgi:uncharacterized protein (UPF0333 family)
VGWLVVGRRAQASLEYMLMFAVGMLIAAIIIYKLIGVKGLAIWAGSVEQHWRGNIRESPESQ